MKNRILLTGATGFVGRQIHLELLKLNVNLTLVVRNELKIINNSTLNQIVVSNDIFAESKSWWVEVLQEVDIVIHAAWFTDSNLYLYSPINLDCLKGTITLAQACVESGVRRFIGIGTCFEYNTDEGYLSINTQLRPNTPYAAAKAATYLALNQNLKQAGIEFAWCRLFYLYGDGENPVRLIPYIKQQLKLGLFAELSDGNQVRDYMDVREAASIIADAALGKKIGPLNICSGSGITIREFAEKIANFYGRTDLLRFGARKRSIHDPEIVVGIR